MVTKLVTGGYRTLCKRHKHVKNGNWTLPSNVCQVEIQTPTSVKHRRRSNDACAKTKSVTEATRNQLLFWKQKQNRNFIFKNCPSFREITLSSRKLFFGGTQWFGFFVFGLGNFQSRDKVSVTSWYERLPGYFSWRLLVVTGDWKCAIECVFQSINNANRSNFVLRKCYSLYYHRGAEGCTSASQWRMIS